MNVRIFIKNKKRMLNLTNAYLFCMFSFFLFYYQDFYFNMTDAKYAFFTFVSVLFISGMFFLQIIRILCGSRSLCSLSFSSIREVISSLSISDWACLCLLASHILTTLCSKYPSASLDGNAGRHLGLWFSFMITLLYFLISRTYKERGLFIVLQGSLCLAVGLGILNFFGIDPLHFFDRIAEYDIPRFLSTLGNISFFANALCLSLPFSITYFCFAVSSRQRLWSLICALFGMAGIYICNADGGYLGIGAFLLCFMVYVFRSYSAGKRFLWLMIAFLCLGQMFHVLTVLFPDAGRGFTTLSCVFIASPLAYLLLICFLIFYLFYGKCGCFKKQEVRKRLQIGLSIGVLVSVGLVFLIVFYVSIVNTTMDLGSFSNYLRYDDAWGTGRGITWNRLLPVYVQDFDWIQKLFGYGLDTTRLLLVDHYDAVDIAYYDNAHNEYLQYLVTSGLVGLFSYCALFFSMQVRLWKRRHSDIYFLALAGCLLAHGFQAIVGLTQPLTTPLLFLLIAIGEAGIRNRKTSIVTNREKRL